MLIPNQEALKQRSGDRGRYCVNLSSSVYTKNLVVASKQDYQQRAKLKLIKKNVQKTLDTGAFTLGKYLCKNLGAK